METLSDELLRVVLSFVTPTDLLRSSSMISKRFARVVRSASFWQLRCEEEVKDSTTDLTKQQIQRYLIYHLVRKEEERQTAPGFLDEGSLFMSRRNACDYRASGPRRCCVASTTDRQAEHIENVLPVEEYQRRYESDRYWSSAPNHDQDSVETVLFCFRSPLAVARTIELKPLKEPYMFPGRERPVFTWRQTVIRVYRLSLDKLTGDWPSNRPCMFERVETESPQTQLPTIIMNENNGRAPPDRATIDALIKSEDPVYVSEAYEVPPDSAVSITYNIPSGVIGNVVTVDLVGKNYEQYPGNGYFVCIERANCIGIPL